ncbi:MAG: hypothetical protein J7M05_12850, partial [Anaerolineae bacterium]|nr:hypothetical protein [Anaerolineae bacterium]
MLTTHADQLTGPWKIYRPGTLRLTESLFQQHIASPDVHPDKDQQQLRMYYHGVLPEGQRTRVALSSDGLHFEPLPEVLGVSYFRVFFWQGNYYALGMPGILYRSGDGLHHFIQGPQLLPKNARHCAVLVRKSTLYIFYTQALDCPESILLSTVPLQKDWIKWQASAPVTVLVPETDYEGAD